MKYRKVDFIQKICKYFDELHFDLDGKNLCVGLSGGADSVSLLYVLLEVKDKYGFSVSACHFNHMIRGEEADRDEEFCKKLCHDLNVKLFCGRDDVPAYCKFNKVSLEQGARDCRYAFFNRILTKDNVDFCVTAHNMNDNAETLIYNLIRGTGLNGAAGIAPVLNQTIMRPMLKISRDEIESYLLDIKGEFVTDSTNLSLEYTRNRIRHILIPELKNINPSAIESISRFIDSCRDDKAYFDDVVSENLDKDLRNLQKSLRRRIILRKYKDYSGNILNNVLVEEIENALFNENRTVLQITNEYDAVIHNGQINFYTRTEDIYTNFKSSELLLGSNIVFSEQVRIDFSDTVFENSENINKIYTTCKLTFDNIIGGLKVRTRQTGDKICIRGINRSLKKLFIDKKIPKEYRDIIPIIFDNEGIIYVPFVGISDRAFSNTDSKSVYIRTIFNTIDKERWKNAYEK